MGLMQQLIIDIVVINNTKNGLESVEADTKKLSTQISKEMEQTGKEVTQHLSKGFSSAFDQIANHSQLLGSIRGVLTNNVTQEGIAAGQALGKGLLNGLGIVARSANLGKVLGLSDESLGANGPIGLLNSVGLVGRATMKGGGLLGDLIKGLGISGAGEGVAAVGEAGAVEGAVTVGSAAAGLGVIGAPEIALGAAVIGAITAPIVLGVGTVFGVAMSAVSPIIVGDLTTAFAQFVDNVVTKVFGPAADAEESQWRTRAIYGKNGDYLLGQATNISNQLGDIVSPGEISSALNSMTVLQDYGINASQLPALGEMAARYSFMTGGTVSTSASDLTSAIMTGNSTGLPGVDVSDTKMKKLNANWEDLDKNAQAQARYNELVKELPDLQAKTSSYQDTMNGQLRAMRNHVEDIHQAWLPLLHLVTPFLQDTNRMLERSSKIMGDFGHILGGTSDQPGLLKPLADWGLDKFTNGLQEAGRAWDGFYKDFVLPALNIVYNIMPALIIAADLALKGIRLFFAGIANSTAFQTFIGGAKAVMTGFLVLSEGVLLLAGIWTDAHHSMGEKTSDLAKVVLRVFLDMIENLVKFLASFGIKLIDMAATVGAGFINMLLGAFDSGMTKLAQTISGFKIHVPAITVLGKEISPAIDAGVTATWGGVGRVNPEDLFTSERDQLNTMSNGIVDLIEGTKSKLGLNMTVADLAKKYNVDLDGFKKLLASLNQPPGNTTTTDNNTPNGDSGNTTSPTSPLAQAISDGNTPLAQAISNLNDTMAGKNMSAKIELNLTEVFEGQYDEATRKKIQKDIKDSLDRALRAGGIATS